MNKKEYSSTIKKTPFEYLVSKKIAKLIKNGLVYEVAFEQCVNKSDLNIISNERRKEVFNVVYDRLIGIDSFLLNQFLNSSVSTSKFILVYAIALNDPLFMEFLLIQYRGAMLSNKKYISISDFGDFFDLIKEKNSVVASRSDATIKQLSGGYRNILVQSGLCKRMKKNIYLNAIILNPLVVQYLENKGEKAFLQAVLGVR